MSSGTVQTSFAKIVILRDYFPSCLTQLPSFGIIFLLRMLRIWLNNLMTSIKFSFVFSKTHNDFFYTLCMYVCIKCSLIPDTSIFRESLLMFGDTGFIHTCRSCDRWHTLRGAPGPGDTLSAPRHGVTCHTISGTSLCAPRPEGPSDTP